MKKIERMKIKLKTPENTGIFHDSRSDVKTIMQALNAIISKQNEIVEAVNILIDAQEKK